MSDSAEPTPQDRERLVALRRYKRRVKAVAAIALSLVAGTFLACQKDKPVARPNPAPNPTTPEISNLPAPEREPGTGGSGSGGSGSGGSGTGGSGGGSGGSGSAEKSNHVDRHEHRKGMPVRDNLVE